MTIVVIDCSKFNHLKAGDKSFMESVKPNMNNNNKNSFKL